MSSGSTTLLRLALEYPSHVFDLQYADLHSVGEMPARETQDRQWGRHSFRHDVSRFRELRGSAESLSQQVQRGKSNSLPAGTLDLLSG